jgi:hypothetical protein
MLLYFSSNLANVRIDVDGLACPVHRPIACDHQTRGQGLMLGVVFSHHCSGVVANLLGMWSSRAWIFDGVSTVWMPVLLNLRWSKSSFTRGTLILCHSHHGI